MKIWHWFIKHKIIQNKHCKTSANNSIKNSINLRKLYFTEGIEIKTYILSDTANQLDANVSQGLTIFDNENETEQDTVKESGKKNTMYIQIYKIQKYTFQIVILLLIIIYEHTEADKNIIHIVSICIFTNTKFWNILRKFYIIIINYNLLHILKQTKILYT